MSIYVLIPFLVALSTILQGGLNKEIGAAWGLPATVLLNATVFLVVSAGLYLLSVLCPQFLPPLLQNDRPFSTFKLWYLVPGICGIMIVLGLPIGFKELGAIKQMTILVGSQIVLALLWDIFVEGSSVSMMRVLAALVTMLGVGLSIIAR